MFALISKVKQIKVKGMRRIADSPAKDRKINSISISNFIQAVSH
jgi:hypothetical protein